MIHVKVEKKLFAESGEMNLSVNLEINSGEFVTIYGDSGAGKTSILRMIAGLLEPDDGTIKSENKFWFDRGSKTNIKPQKRNVGLLFQDYSLFPNMTVYENIAFAGKENSDSTFIKRLVDLIELEKLKDRKPYSLSGGQKQRVALARALAQKPTILLLDEPLSALNDEIRIKLQDYILKLHKELNLTTLLVSHDIPEIFKLSDNVYQISDGKIKNVGKPEEIFIEKNISGKFKFTGTVLKITKSDVVFLVSILIGKDVVRVIATSESIKKYSVGDKVLVVSKAFNPIILKI